MATQEVEQALTLGSAAPNELLRMAVSQGAGIETLEKLLDLQLRYEKNEARKAYVVAMNAFKQNPPTILKNKSVSFGQTSYSHATLDHVCDAVTKGLSEHGISHRWKVDQLEGWIKVTCILTHDMGHSEETTLQGQPDQSGSKNSIQAIGSTVTYLQRYSLLAATGLAASNGDTDGHVTNGELSEQLEWIGNAGSSDELKRLYKQAYEKFEDNPSALKAIIAARKAKQEEF